MELTAEERSRLEELEKVVQSAVREKVAYMREIARSRGLTADTLEKLRSESGEPFMELEEVIDLGGREALIEMGFVGRTPAYKCAVVVAEVLAGSQVIGHYAKAKAYLCANEEKDDACGWVVGEPLEQSYDNISSLSGSAGKIYLCLICGKQVGRRVMLRS